MIYPRQVIRLRLDVEKSGLTTNAVDNVSGTTPLIWRGTDVQFDIGIFQNNAPSDISNFTSLTLEVFDAARTGASLMQKTISSGLTATITEDDWNAGTDQHVQVPFTNAESNLSLDGNLTKVFWLVVSGLTSDAPVRRITLGGTVLTIHEDATPSSGAIGPLQGGNIIPGGATYDGGGNYTLTPSPVADKVFRWTKNANDTDFGDDVGAPITVSGIYQTAPSATQLDLTGTAGQAVTAVVRDVVYLTADEADSRFRTPSLTWRGTYSGATQYYEGDVVYDNGSAWRAKINTIGNAPPTLPTTSNTEWEALSIKGDTGAAQAAFAYESVADETARLATTSKTKGDIVHQQDTNRLYLFTGTDETDTNDWTLLPELFTFLGEWDSTTAYVIGNAVQKNGSTYYAAASSTDVDPADPANSATWQIMAAGAEVSPAGIVSALGVDSVSVVGISKKYAREDHVHAIPDRATQVTPGFMSAPDKLRFDHTEAGWFNGVVKQILKDGDWFYAVGSFTTFNNHAAPGIAKFDAYGKADPLFDIDDGFDVGPVGIAKTSDGDFVVWNDSQKISLNGATAEWMWKIDTSGNEDGGFDAPDTIAASGTEQLISVAVAGVMIVCLTPRSARVIDNTGTSKWTATSDGDMYWVFPFGTNQVVLCTRHTVSFDSDLNPAGAKLMDVNQTTGELTIDTDWTTNAGTGADAACVRGIADTDHVIVANVISALQGVDTSWNGGVTTKHEGFYKLNAGTAGTEGTEDGSWDIEVVKNDPAAFLEPLAIDAADRVYFTGDVQSINGTSVTAYRLYRVDEDGVSLNELGSFNGRVRGVVLVSQQVLCVYGDFNKYGDLPVGGMVFIDDQGVRLHNLEVVNAASKVGVYRTRYLDAGAMLSRIKNGATSEKIEFAATYMVTDAWVFTNGVDEYVNFKYQWPQEWNEGVLKVILFWMPKDGGTTGGVAKWGIAMGARDDGEVIDAALGTEVVVTDVTQGDGKLCRTALFPDLTVGQTPGDKKLTFGQIRRNGADATDTLDVGARLLGVGFQFLEQSTDPAVWS